METIDDTKAVPETAEQRAERAAYDEEMGRIRRESANVSPRPSLVQVADKVEQARVQVRSQESNVQNQERTLREARLQAARTRAHRDYWVERLTREAKS